MSIKPLENIPEHIIDHEALKVKGTPYNDERYLKLDQITPQTVTGTPEFPDLKITTQQLGTPTYSTVNDFCNSFGSCGRKTGGAITDAGSSYIAVAAGTGYIKATDDDNAQLMNFDWSAPSNILIPADTVRYIGVEYNAGSPRVVARTAWNWNKDSEFSLGRVVNETINGVETLHIINNPWWVTDGMTNVIERMRGFGHILKDENAGGGVLSVTGTRNVAVTGFTLWSNLNKFDISAIDTNVSGNIKLYWYKAGSGWQYSDVTQYSVLLYNDVTQTTLQNLSNNKYANIWVYAEADDQEISLIYPQRQYDTEAEAEAATTLPILPTHIQNNGYLIGRIIIKQNVDAPVKILQVSTSSYTSSTATDHNDLAGLQGGTTDEYYHLTNAEYGALHDAVTVTDTTSIDLTLTGQAIQADVKANGINDTHIDWGTGASQVSAGDVPVDASGFSGNLSASDTDVQTALGTIDALSVGGGVGTGATVPASPATGELFLHTPTGRTVLLEYDGSNWQPIISYGTMVIYVDSTDGTDAIDKGVGVDANAFKTVQYAINQIPGLYSGNVTVYINNETYSETVEIGGKNPTGNYTITLEGTYTTTATLTASTGSAQGTGATRGTFVTAGGLTASAYKNMIIQGTSGVNNGVYRVIDDNTTTTATIIGTWSGGAPANTDTANVYSSGTKITRITLGFRQSGIICKYIELQGDSSNVAIYPKPFATIALFGCFLTGIISNQDTSNYRALQVAVSFESCVISVSSGNVLQGAINCYIDYSKYIGGGKGTGRFISMAGPCFIYVSSGTTITDCQYGIMGSYNVNVQMVNDGGRGYIYVTNCTTGLYAQIGTVMAGTANNQYSGNTADENAVAASYGYID